MQAIRFAKMLVIAAAVAAPILLQDAMAQGTGGSNLGYGAARPGADAGRGAAVGTTPGTSMSSPASGALSSPSSTTLAPSNGLSANPGPSTAPTGGTGPATAVPAPTQGTVPR